MHKLNDYKQTLIGSDVSGPERRAFLEAIPQPKKISVRKYADGTIASSGCGEDVCGQDSRSLKAQLAGRGDLRAKWWHLNHFAHLVFGKRATLESAMFQFHSRHHFLTLTWLGFKCDLRELARVIRSEGVLAGFRVAREQESRKSHRE